MGEQLLGRGGLSGGQQQWGWGQPLLRVGEKLLKGVEKGGGQRYEGGDKGLQQKRE